MAFTNFTGRFLYSRTMLGLKVCSELIAPQDAVLTRRYSWQTRILFYRLFVEIQRMYRGSDWSSQNMQAFFVTNFVFLARNSKYHVLDHLKVQPQQILNFFIEGVFISQFLRFIKICLNCFYENANLMPIFLKPSKAQFLWIQYIRKSAGVLVQSHKCGNFSQILHLDSSSFRKPIIVASSSFQNLFCDCIGGFQENQQN